MNKEVFQVRFITVLVALLALLSTACGTPAATGPAAATAAPTPTPYAGPTGTLSNWARPSPTRSATRRRPVSIGSAFFIPSSARRPETPCSSC